MTEKVLSDYEYTVGYGVGQYYYRVKAFIPFHIHFDYLCDKRWKQIGKECDGIPVISPEPLCMLKKVFVIVFAETEKIFSQLECY